MTCLFHDIHEGDQQKLREQRIAGMQADELLYADDTICITQEEQPMNKLLASIEREGERYGLKLNKKKCEYLYFGPARPVFFADGTPVPPQLKKVKYLGCNLNDKADPGKEVNTRIADCMITLNKLHPFLYTSDNSVARKVDVFNAIVTAKVTYGLVTLVMNTAVLRKLDTFQLKGLRTILKFPTTYIDTDYSNECIRNKVNNILAENKKKPL